MTSVPSSPGRQVSLCLDDLSPRHGTEPGDRPLSRTRHHGSTGQALNHGATRQPHISSHTRSLASVSIHES